MKTFRYLFIAAAAIILVSFKKPDPLPLYKNKSAPIESRVNDLLKRMTLDEKVMQLSQYTLGLNDNENNIDDLSKDFDPHAGSLIYFGSDPVFRNAVQKKAVEETRLGIPILFGFDIIHGCKTLYPIPLAVGCSWNTELNREACSNSAKETYLSGINWTFSPMVDVARDPRWGRVAEGYGEDPYTGAQFGASAVRGYQGQNLSAPNNIAACLKHYVAYGLVEGGRDYSFTDVSQQLLQDTYLVSFKAGVKAGASTVMSSFNDISGTPATINKYLLTDILKTQWGFKGFVVADWQAIAQLMNQGVAKDPEQAGERALNAGLDMDMLSDIYRKYIPDLLKQKKISMATVDEAVKRVLTLKFKLGLFDNPYTPVVDESQRYLQPEAKRVANQMAAESMVLLKNKDNILPILSSIKSVAIIGPMVKDSADLMGSWTGRANAKDVESINSALQNEFAGKLQLNYAHGCNFDGKDDTGFDEAINAAKNSDEVILFLGEKNSWSGENTSRSTIALPEIQERLVAAIKKTGKPLVIVLNNGRPLALRNIEPDADAILEAWQPGTIGATAITGILSGRINPSGKLDITFPLTTGQIPVYYDMHPRARLYQQGNYQDIPTEPLYWFGHGLSYTTYNYSDVKLSSTKIKKNEHLVAKVEVNNTGKMDGKEAVLWYISHPEATISRPRKELKFFEKKLIKQGEKVVYTFDLDPERDLSYPDANGKQILESGDYYLIVGSQKVKFEVTD